jgi:hypothetical protein
MEWISDHALLLVMIIIALELFLIGLLLGESSNRAVRQIDVWGETFRGEMRQIHDRLQTIVRRLPPL